VRLVSIFTTQRAKAYCLASSSATVTGSALLCARGNHVLSTRSIPSCSSSREQSFQARTMRPSERSIERRGRVQVRAEHRVVLHEVIQMLGQPPDLCRRKAKNIQFEQEHNAFRPWCRHRERQAARGGQRAASGRARTRTARAEGAGHSSRGMISSSSIKVNPTGTNLRSRPHKQHSARVRWAGPACCASTRVR